MKVERILILLLLLVLFCSGCARLTLERKVLRLYMMGTEARQIGRYYDALNFLEGSLQIARSLNFADGICNSLCEMSIAYLLMGEYDKALRHVEEALETGKRFDKPRCVSKSLSYISLIHKAVGRYDEALKYNEEAIEINKKLNIPNVLIAVSLNSRGAIYFDLGDYDRALKYFEECLGIVKRLNNPRYINTALNNIGAVYLALKDYKKAEYYFTQAKRELVKAGSVFVRSGYLVSLYITTGRYRKSLSPLRDMAPQWWSSRRYRMMYHTFHGLALFGVGDLKKASKELLTACELVEGEREKVHGEKIGFFVSEGRILPYKALVAALSERVVMGECKDLTFDKYGHDLSSAAFYFSESTKARILIERIATSARKYHSPEISPQLREKEQMLIAQLSQLDKTKEDAYKKGEEAFKEHEQTYKRVKAEMDELIAKLRKEYPRYAALMYPRPFRVEDLPLGDNEVLLEYELTEKAGYLFVVEKGKVKKIVKITKGKEEIEGLVGEFLRPFNRDPITSSTPYKEFSIEKGKKLYDLLLSRVLKDISPKKDIIIVPDGILGALPFEALVIKEGKDYRDSLYVGDKYKITYSQSATVLALNRMLKPSKAKRPLFALGNPIYNENDRRYIAYRQGKKPPPLLAQNSDQYALRVLVTRREWGKTTKDDTQCEITFPPLPETETEVKEIARLFRVKPEPPDILLNIYANETYLRQVPLKHYQYLHFATHADLPGKVQGIKEPFILLGQVENKKKDDGFLTMTEVLEMQLDADMVVLSACLTGRGKVMEGEGVLNFARAFQHAGARSVVVSLWEVPSKAAVEFMTNFYSLIKKGKSRSEALRRTRKEIKDKYPNPYFWAVFILHGEA